MKYLAKQFRSEWATWNSCRSRCFNPSVKGFKNYGGRGITVCDRWKTFANFLEDMGPRPTGMTLDRIDNDGDYEPSNCRWTTREQQNSNRRSARLVVFRGVSMSLAEAHRLSGAPIAYATAHLRIQRGWGIEAALVTPLVVMTEPRPRESLWGRRNKGASL